MRKDIAALRLYFKNIISIISENLEYIIMKRFKIIDVWISILLIIFCVMRSLILSNNAHWDNFFYIKKDVAEGYFIVGGWQFISIIVHALNKSFAVKISKRYRYQITVFFLVGISLLVFIFKIPGILFALLLLLFIAGPFMAIYYIYICYQETYVKMKRPLDQLK